MPRGKRKRIIVETDSEDEIRNPRRSSLRVNLSYTSNLSDQGGSDSDYASLKKTTTECDETLEDQNENVMRTVKKRIIKYASTDTAIPASVANVTVIDAADRKVSKNKPSKRQQHSMSAIKEKEQQLNKSCIELQNAILSKTQLLLDSDLSKRTSEIFTGHSSNNRRDVEENVADRSLDVRTNFGKNDQIFMTGCGKKQNPVRVGSMSKNLPSDKNSNYNASQHSDHDSSDCSQSIASTPKKSNIETSVDKSTGKTSKQIIKIPVARLFADNNPDNSMSEINPVPPTENLISDISKEQKENQSSHVSKISNELNNTVSPILSQGTRRARISRLSLKNKLAKEKQQHSRISTDSSNESFINRPPLTCSSIIERPNRICNEANLDHQTKTVVLEEKSESTEIQKTINLDDNENNTNTINIDYSSTMEITTISARTPIVRSIRDVQQIIKKSFRFHTADIPGNITKKSGSLNKKSTNTNECSIKKTSKANSANTENKNIYQNDCSVNTVRTSLNVNTSLDDVSLSERMIQKGNEKLSNTKQLVDNQEKEEGTAMKSNQASSGIVRCSMQMNTSLDSVQKSPNTQEPLNYNKILSMVEKTSLQSPDGDSETENLSLIDRILIKNKKIVHEQDGSEDMKSQTYKGNNKSTSVRKSNELESSSKITKISTLSEESNVRKKSSRKSKNNSTSRDSGESSTVEPTPFPASRSLLFKTIIKNNIAMNTLNPRRLEESSDDNENDRIELALSEKTNSSTNKHSSVQNEEPLSDDTVIVNSSDESSKELSKERERVVIDESLNDTGNQNKSKINKRKSRKTRKQIEPRTSDSSGEEEENKKVKTRKLYPLRENSQISFSAAEMSQLPRELVPKNIKTKKRRQITQNKRKNVKVNAEPVEESDHSINEIIIQKPEKKKKKPRKIKSKKIVIKKITNMTLLGNMLKNDEGVSSTNERNSLEEFDLRRGKIKTKNFTSHKIVIVVTGFDKDDRDLVKNAIKSLGSALMQANVTPRTTHVISSGVRTINLLKGIIRGCWLLKLEWALESLTSEKWLNPAPFEMAHFAKAVQVNRRDRELFGKGYVPELFVTCGAIYIENGTSPPTASLKELVKTAGGMITEDSNVAKIIVGLEGLRENWILDSITTGEIQPFDQYKRK